MLTSATLTVDGRFDYIRARLGIGDADEIRLASEFDFARQAILYLPPRMPDPRSDNFAVAAGREVIEILQAHARPRLRAVHQLRDDARGAGDGGDGARLSDPRAGHGAALAAARTSSATTPHAVLFATSSFWQGVDVVGEALSCVIVDKMPFASPGDPITAARIEPIRARGGDPFGEYQVPLAILALQQGLGRLIRHRTRSRRPRRARSAAADDGLRPAVRRVAAAGAGRPRSRRPIERDFFCLIATVGKLIGRVEVASYFRRIPWSAD